MLHHKAVQLKDSGLWHFATLSSKGGYPFPCDDTCRHKTAEEACDHARDYRADNLHKDHFPRQQHKCEYPDCKKWTTYGLRPVGEYATVHLCRDHRSKDGWKATQEYGTTFEEWTS